MLYILTSVWVLRTPKAGQNNAKMQKSNKLSAKFGPKFSKKEVFKFAPKRWSIILFPDLTFDERFGANLKKQFFC